MGPSGQSIDGVVEEIMRIHRSLPSRPGIDDVEAAMALVRNVDKEEQARIDAISKQKKGFEIPEELFFVLQEMQKNLAYFQGKEQKREALKLLDLENIHFLFDELIQRASKCVPSSSKASAPSISAGTAKVTAASSRTSFATNTTVSSVVHSAKGVGRSLEGVSMDDSYLKKAKSTMYADEFGSGDSHVSRGLLLNPTARPQATSAEDSEKLSLIKLASLIEVSAKKGTRDLNLQNKLMDQIDWLPDSIWKLSGLVTLDLSENRIILLPATIGALSSLEKLDLQSNRIAELPDSIGELYSLLYLDLKGNQLMSLPSTIGKLVHLEELDLSSNQLSLLPDAIGNLVRLKKLNIETNDIEELPHTIGHCVSLVELRADYNRLKGLPEAVGRMESLEILSVRYNNIKGLPTTMASLSKLKEVDVSFNELESVPESLCLATTLVKLNIGNNFADFQSLPRSIGNLEMLEELDISNNQIRVLPDSFGMLSQLHVLHAEENPLALPPRHIAEMGAQAVVQYMAEHVAKKDVKLQPVKSKKSWAKFRFPFKSLQKKHDGLVYIT
ncbi:plant intracellular Ras-group-related LRR protein 4 isoform X1 [Elaeis guineensis]|uniref:Plant intracellular Ras-group-related LRR protein 4 isoform X1 n=1 Tax=Elaeis guineensis var. tenera TaxID=51953 RepID=A0A6I9SGT2_ELAGV|nr:plant intracellular Ras-group-related LRR protein 4 isoform X1 [Elaeis guineensis]XP_010943506.1 plant intracellular Ras-group-related LRR protein 4 isoform X1 [Elaeis guineensis]